VTPGDSGDTPRTVVTQAEFARRQNRPRQWVNKKIKRGDLTPPAILRDGRVWVEEAERQLAAATAEPEIPVGLASDAPVLAAERARKEAAQARLKEIELAKAQGELVAAADIEAEIEDLCRGLRDELLQLPREVAGDCARLAEEIAIEARIMQAMKARLESFSTRLKEVGPHGGGP
jgi:phage terminase Nu1 subunit (DNA packaging protein)